MLNTCESQQKLCQQGYWTLLAAVSGKGIAVSGKEIAVVPVRAPIQTLNPKHPKPDTVEFSCLSAITISSKRVCWHAGPLYKPC